MFNRSSPIQSRSSTFSPDPHRLDPSSINLNENAFNQGYYSKFFVELKKLGKGFRGSVFLCEVNKNIFFYRCSLLIIDTAHAGWCQIGQICC